MSKFKVGDRVVVVRVSDQANDLIGTRGKIDSIMESAVYEFPIELDSTGTLFKPEELEFEHVYDELSAKPAEQSPSKPAPVVEVRQEDAVEHPSHYTSHPSGVECIQVTEHMNFNLGNATKYIWRAGLKSENPIEDLQKAAWYIAREIQRLGGSDADS